MTRDVKARVRRVIGELEAVEQQQDPIFASPRDVFLGLVLSIQIEAACRSLGRKVERRPAGLVCFCVCRAASPADAAPSVVCIRAAGLTRRGGDAI
jgi:hypothetical protein